MIGVFEFIIAMVLISTIGKVLTARQSRPALTEAPLRPDVVHQLNDAITELSSRVERLEDERDFYRALLEPPDRGVPPLPPADEASGDRG